MLTENQISWIFEKVKQFTNKYQQIADTDEYWESLKKELEQIYVKSRNNELCKLLLFAVIDYLEAEEREGSNHGRK